GLFALHPLNVESVAWVAERKAVLCMVFLLLTLWAYVWYSRRPGVGRYLLMAMLFAFALMSKIMVVTLPFAMVLLDYWPLGRIQPTTNSRGDSGGDSGESSTEPFFAGLKRSLVEKIPLFAISAAAALVTLRIHRNEGALTSAMPFVWRLKNALVSY